MGRTTSLHLPTNPLPIQLSNKTLWNDGRSIEEADFYTIGYSGRTIDEVLELLTKAGVSTVVDIRHTPVSMYKPDFSKAKLVKHLAWHGIQYAHFGELGIPRDIRGLAVGQPTRDVLWDWYDRNVVRYYVGRNLDRFLNTADHPVALMCTEIDPTACHRHRLHLALERHGLRGFDL